MEVRAYDSQGNLKYQSITGVSVGSISAGTTLMALGLLSFANSNGVTFGLNGNTLTASAAGGGGGGSLNVSAGTTSNNLTALTFSNLNGISFGLNGSVITAQHNAITTARASTDGIGLATAQTNVTWTVNSAGISLNAAGYAGTTSGTQTTAGVNVVMTHNSLGLNLGVPAYITTARASNDAVGLATAQTNVTWTVNSAGISLNAGGYAGTTSGTQTTAGVNVVMTHNTAGLNLGVPAYITTARASTDGVGLATAQTNVTWTVNSAGISLNAGGYAGTATGFTGANISATMTHNSVGLSLSLSVAAPGAAAENNWVHLLGANTLGNTTASGSTIGWSAGPGLTLSGTNGSQVVISVGPYITSQSTAPSGIAVLPGVATITAGVVNFQTGNGITFGLAGSTITASHNGLTTAAQSDHSHGNPTLALTNLSGTTASASNGFTLSLSAAAPGGGAGVTLSGYSPFLEAPGQIGAGGNRSLSLFPINLPDFQYDRVNFGIYNTNSSNSSGSHSYAVIYGLYTRNASTLSLLYSASQSTAITHSGTAGSYSLYSGLRLFTVGNTQTITAGNYWIGVISSSTSGGANGSYSMYQIQPVNSNFLGHVGSSHNTTYQMDLGLGIYSATTAAMPASIGFTQIQGSAASAFRKPIIFFASSTV